jgi:hypothetical protein
MAIPMVQDPEPIDPAESGAERKQVRIKAAPAEREL